MIVSEHTERPRDRTTVRDAWDVLVEAGGIVTAVDIAERLGISRARVGQLTTRDDWPEPVTRVGRSPVWLWEDVRAWRAIERRPGPKPVRKHEPVSVESPPS